MERAGYEIPAFQRLSSVAAESRNDEKLYLLNSFEIFMPILAAN